VNEAQLPMNGLGVGETTAVFFPGAGSTVTLNVDATSAVTESDETNNSFTGMLPVPTAPLPCIVTPTFTPSPTPVALIGPYAVTLVAANDVLNIRSAPGASNPISGSFTYNAVNVMRTGPTQQADGADWVEVLMPDGVNKGWVNFKYLTEYVSHDAFCAEPYVRMQIDLMRISTRDSNGGLLASLVSSKHGINMGYWQHGPTTNYTTTTAKTIFTDTQNIDWGSGGASGIEDIGTFAQIVQPQINDVFNSAYELKCDDPSYASMYPNPWPYTNVHYYAVVKPPMPGVVFDWKVWLIGVEYVNGAPYLFGTVHYVWEP